MNLTRFMKLHPLPVKPVMQGDVIPEGQRNSTLSRFALRVLKKYGAGDSKAHQAFADESAKCSPPLDNRELQTIWNSAMKCYREKVQTNLAYIPPAEYAVQDFEENLLPTISPMLASRKSWRNCITVNCGTATRRCGCPMTANAGRKTARRPVGMFTI